MPDAETGPGSLDTVTHTIARVLQQWDEEGSHPRVHAEQQAAYDAGLGALRAAVDRWRKALKQVVQRETEVEAALAVWSMTWAPKHDDDPFRFRREVC